MDRCDVGFGFGVVSGFIAVLDSTVYFAVHVSSVRIVAYLVAGYLVAAWLSLLVLWSAFMLYKGRRMLGGIVMFVTSLSFPVNFILFMLPPSIPIGSIPIFYYNPLPASYWLLFGMIGGILILSAEMKQKRARALAFSIFAGVLAFFITPMIVVLDESIIFGVIPLTVAVLTFAFFSVKKERMQEPR